MLKILLQIYFIPLSGFATSDLILHRNVVFTKMLDLLFYVYLERVLFICFVLEGWV